MSTAGWCTVQGCPCRPHEVYHKFPGDEMLLELWLKAIKAPKSEKPILLRLSSRICSLHFTDEDYDKIVEDGGLVLEPLKSTAVPSIFPWTESWPCKKKKKKDDDDDVTWKKPTGSAKKQTFSCPCCDFSSNRAQFWQTHRRNHEEENLHRCDQCSYSSNRLRQLNIHISRDHISSTTEADVGRRSARQKALKENESRSKQKSRSSKSSESDDSGSYYSDSDESASGTLSSSSDSSIIKSASAKLPRCSEHLPDGTIKTSASLKGMKSDHSYAVKRELDETTVVKVEETIESGETVVKKENQATDGEKKERKIIWVVSETADD